MTKETMIRVANRDSGIVTYSLPELGVKRRFQPREEKEVPFGELEALSYIRGGQAVLKDYLVIKNEEALKELLPHVEPEYFYSKEEVEKLLTEGTMDQFLDCLDFAPQGVLELIKESAVNLPLNDVAKRDAIKEKIGFDVTKAIEIKNTKYDGEEEESFKKKDEGENKASTRRTAAPKATTPAAPERRSKYTIIDK